MRDYQPNEELPAVTALGDWRWSRLRPLALLGAFLLAASWGAPSRDRGRALAESTQSSGIELPKPSYIDNPELLRISEEEALALNAKIPVDPTPGTPAAPFLISGNRKPDYARAKDCLATAIYYEARGEGADGQKAVAQVVLNRVRHRAFPATVCGVVFEGSTRQTGCQFSFTCDGSLSLPPKRSGWAMALKIAESALGGHVYKPVGWATHFHADWVFPIWAPKLLKSAVVGRHIFYRWNRYDLARAARKLYGGNEPDIDAMGNVDIPLEEMVAELPLEAEIDGGTDEIPQPLTKADEIASRSKLNADLVTFRLKQDTAKAADNPADRKPSSTPRDEQAACVQPKARDARVSSPAQAIAPMSGSAHLHAEAERPVMGRAC